MILLAFCSISTLAVLTLTLSFVPSLRQSNTVLHLDLVTGAVRRLMLSQDSEQSSTRASNWWSSKEQQVRDFAQQRKMSCGL